MAGGFFTERIKQLEEDARRYESERESYYRELEHARNTPVYTEQQINNIQNQYAQLQKEFGKEWDKDSLSKTSMGLKNSIQTLRAQNARRGRFRDNDLDNYLLGLEDYINHVGEVTSTFDTAFDYENYQKYSGKSDSDLYQAKTDLLVKNGGKRDEEYDWIENYLNSAEHKATLSEDDLRQNLKYAQIRQGAAEEQAMKAYEQTGRTGQPWDVNNVDLYTNLLRSAENAQQEAVDYGKMAYDRHNADTYAALRQNKDFFDKSQYNPLITDQTYRLVMDQGARDRAATTNAMGRNPYTGESGFENFDYMTDEHRAMYSYIYRTQGKDEAEKYRKSIQNEVNAQKMEAINKASQQLGQSWITGIPASLMSVPANLASGLGMIDAAIQNAHNVAHPEDYRPIDYNTESFRAYNTASGIRKGGTERWGNLGTIHVDEKKAPLLARFVDGKGFGDIYQLGMSMADSAAIMGISAALGPLGRFGTMLLGGAAGTQGMFDALDRGATDSQAITMGFLNGAFETIFEYVSIENILDNMAFKKVWQQIASQALAEGSEEFNTTIFNTLADILVMAEKSDYKKNAQKYIEQGATPEQANKKALGDVAIQLMWDAIGGALSGGLMGGAHYALNTAISNREWKSTVNNVDKLQKLVNQTLEADPENKIAQKLKGRQTATGNQIRKMAEQGFKAMSDTDKANVKAAVGERIEAVTGTTNAALADAITKSFTDEDLSRREKKLLRDNEKVAKQIINELSDVNDSADSAWVKNIETKSVTLGSDIFKTKIDTFQSPAERQLRALGETGDTQEIARVIAKELSGGTLTEEEQATLDNSQYGQEVLNGMKNEMENDTGEYMQAKALYESTENITKAATARLEELGNTDSNLASAIAKTVTGEELTEAEQTAFNNSQSIAESVVKDLQSGRADRYFIDKYADAKVSDTSPQTQAFKSLMRMKLDTQDEVLFENAMSHAYKLAQQGLSLQQVMNSKAVQNLTSEQITVAWTEGHADQTAKKQPTVRSNPNTGNISALGIKLSDLEKRFNDTQKIAYKLLSQLAKATGLNIVLYESNVNSKGEFTGAQGKFASSDNNTLYIDVNAGLNFGTEIGDLAKYTMMRTFTHEFTHFIETWSPQAYNELRETVFKYMPDAVDKIDNMMAQTGKGIDYASREVVAEALVDILPQTQFISDLYGNHKTIFDKMYDSLKKWTDEIREHFNGMGETTEQARAVKRQFGEAVQYAEDIVKAFDKAAKSAVENMNRAGIAVDEKANYGSISDIQESVRYLLDDKQRSKTVAALAERFGVTEQEAESWLKSETSLASLITNPKYSAYLDYEADPTQEAIKKNSDYAQGTVDFSNICAKRRELTMVMNRILRQFPYQVFLATDLAKIRTIMEQEGFNVPCAICYVEDRRQRDTIVAKGFIDDLQRYRNGETTNADGKKFGKGQIKAFEMVADDDYTPSVYELASLEGLNALKEKDEAMERAWRTYNNARGMASINLPLNDAEYKRQILKYTAKQVKAKNDLGGLRIYSYSDLEMFHLIDIIQVITDAATVGLSIQGYTKVNEYAKAVKDTGLKLNRSLIPKGDLGYHIEDGKVVLDFDTKEGIDINHPDFFDSKDNANIGNILIGINPEQIRAAMVSDFVDMIIPFHTGQSKSVLREKGIDAWQNYKDSQTEKDLATGTVSDRQINIYTEVLQVLEREGKEINKRSFVEKFLEVCKENNLKPRFAEFLNVDANGDYVYTEGYHKFLVDFKTFAQTEVGEYLPQMPVKPIFDDAYTTQILKDYVKSQKVKDADIAKKMPTVIDRITDEIVKSGETQYQSRVTPEQDAEYLELAKDPEKNKAKLESIIEQAARAVGYDSPMLYHGTNAFGFTQIDTKKSNDRISFFATDSTETAGTYSGTNAPRSIITADGQSSLGMYQLYANTDGMLELDAAGAESNHIKLGETEHDYNYDSNKKSWYTHATAKQIAQFAKRNGYTGVIIKNVVDTGTPTSRVTASPATVYIFFDPQSQVKSADPVTYDNDGNVIPLSERFNSENDDIRHQERTEIITNRDLLVSALESVTGTEEKKILEDYKAKLDSLNEKSAQLADIRKQIHDIMFTKGSDRSQLAKLNNQAAILQTQIARADKTLTKVEAMEPMRQLIEVEKKKVRKAQAEKGKQRLADYREGREKAEIRENIRKLMTEFQRRLENPSIKKFVPKELQDTVLKLMKAIDITTPRTLNNGKVKAQSKSAKAQAEALAALYDRMKNKTSADNAEYPLPYDPVAHEMVVKLTETIGNTPVNNMTLEQLQATYATLRAVRETITKAAKLIDSKFKQDAYDTGSHLIGETRDADLAVTGEGLSGYINSQLTPDSFFNRMAGHKKNSYWSLVGDMFYQGTKKSLSVQRDFYYMFRDLSENKAFNELTRFDKRHLVDVGLVDSKGNAVPITKGMALSIYMHLANADNIRHILYGGLTVPVFATYYAGKVSAAFGKGKINAHAGNAMTQLWQTAQQLRELRKAYEAATTEGQREKIKARMENLQAKCDELEARGNNDLDQMKSRIEKILTPYDKELIKRAHEWYDKKSRGYINETTMKMYGIEKANVENYYSIHTDTDYLASDFESIAKNINLENSGFLKDRVPSQKPILLTDICYELDNNVQNVAKYYGYATAQRNFNKIYNTTINGGAAIDSVKAAVGELGKKNGAAMRSAQDYIERYIGDIVGSKTEPNFLGTFRGYVARGSLTLNLKVALAQAASIPNAAAEVGWGSMMRGFLKGFGGAFSHNAKEELAKKSVYFWQRYRGEGGMREFSEAKGSGNRLDRLWNKAAKARIGRYILNWCQDVDTWSTYTMWAMAEDWVEHNTDIRRGTAEFDKAVEDKYDSIIRHTQPNYTVTERSDMLRNKNELFKTFTMFKTQPNQNFNILYDSASQLRRYRKDLKAGKNGVTKADVRQAAVRVANAYTAVMIGAPIAYVGLRFLANVLLQNLNPYRDKDDEITWKSVGKGMAMEYASMQTGMMLYGAQLYEVAEALITGNNYYGPSDSALSLISESGKQTYNFLSKAIDPKEKLSASDWEKTAQKNLSMWGIPYSNAKKFYKGARYWIEDVQNGDFFKFEASAERTNTVQYNRLFKALDNKEKYDTIYNELYQTLTMSGKTDKEAKSQIKSKLLERVKDMYQDGGLTENDAIAMLTKYAVFDMDKDKAYWKVKEWQYNETKDDDDNDFSKYGAVFEAVRTGQEFDTAKKDMLDHGYDEKKINTEVNKKIKEWYMDGEITEQQARTMLQKYTNTKDVDGKLEDWNFNKDNGWDYSERKSEYLSGEITRTELIDAMVAQGKTRQEAEEQATLYDWQAEGLDVGSISVVSDYYEFAEPAGISKTVYVDYYKQTKGLSADVDANGEAISGSKKKKVLAVIDKLPISAAQKDALYYANDWAASTINEAPWH